MTQTLVDVRFWLQSRSGPSTTFWWKRSRHQHRRRVHSVATTGGWWPGLAGSNNTKQNDAPSPDLRARALAASRSATVALKPQVAGEGLQW